MSTVIVDSTIISALRYGDGEEGIDLVKTLKPLSLILTFLI